MGEIPSGLVVYSCCYSGLRSCIAVNELRSSDVVVAYHPLSHKSDNPFEV